jgi:hypothetical protein
MYFILLILYIFNCYSIRLFKNKYLNTNQWEILKKYITNPETNINIKNKIDKIIYFYYDDWSYYKALNFKKFHYNKCKHISLIELYSYSNMGLLKAIKKYNGKSNFTKYAEFYINGELYKGLTELYPISSISKKDRTRKRNISDVDFLNRQKNTGTTFVGYDDWLYEKLDIKNNYYSYKNYWEYNYENYEEFWEKTNLLNPFERYLIHSKFDYFLKSKESNINLAKKFSYSEEYIRIMIKNSLKKILTDKI